MARELKVEICERQAIGRQVWASQYSRDESDDVTVSRQEQVFDGDGRPVIEKLGADFFHINNVPTGPLTMNRTGYQVWSTVLGKSLMTLYNTGDKRDTSVFAGGMVVAHQVGGSGGDPANNSVYWEVTDPVTGTAANFGPTGNLITEEHEPLGQTIQLTNPGTPPLPVAGTGKAWPVNPNGSAYVSNPASADPTLLPKPRRRRRRTEKHRQKLAK